MGISFNPFTGQLQLNPGQEATGTVTSTSVATANGFAGTVANPTTTPAITIETTVTGVLYGNGTSVTAATGAEIPPAGSNMQFEYNNNGVMAGSPALLYDGSNVRINSDLVPSNGAGPLNIGQLTLPFSASNIETYQVIQDNAITGSLSTVTNAVIQLQAITPGGGLSLFNANNPSGNTGPLLIFTGNATSGNSGNITLTPGTATGTVGIIQLNASTTIGTTSTTPTHSLNSSTATNGSGVGTISNLPSGFSGNPTGYISININGSQHIIPYW